MDANGLAVHKAMQLLVGHKTFGPNAGCDNSAPRLRLNLDVITSFLPTKMLSKGNRFPVPFPGTHIAAVNSDAQVSVRRLASQFLANRQLRSLPGTVATTFATYLIFLIQGIIVARLLGPEGRGEFGSCLYFPRDILLYAGLLGSVEVITAHAARGMSDPRRLRGSAARLGLVTGSITAVVAGVLATVLFYFTDRSYLIPYALFCCLFVPLEHIQLTMSAVDRGSGAFKKYNLNRLFLALSFPVLAVAAWVTDLATLTSNDWLGILCGIWVLSRIIGVLPTLYPPQNTSKQPLNQGAASSDVPTVPGVRRLLIEGRFYALSMLVSEIFERLDIFLVLALCSLVDAGNYLVALPAAAILTIVPNAFGVFTFNYGAKLRGPLSSGIAIRVMLAVAIIQLITASLYSLVVDDLILFCFSDRFAQAIPLVLLLLPAFAIKGFSQAADAFLKGRDKPMIGVRARLASIVFMSGFVAIAWNDLGMPAIPVAVGIGQAISMVVIAGAVLQECRETNSRGEK